MLLNATCKAGKVQISEEGYIRVQAPFNKTVWQELCQNITRIAIQPVGLAHTIMIHTAECTHTIELMTKANAEKLQSLFPHLQAETAARATHWYQDITKRAYVATYTNQKAMQKEVEQAAQHGWMPQTSVGIAGHINVGRTATAAALTGGVSLLFGASRSKDKITITFVHTPEWLAANG